LAKRDKEQKKQILEYAEETTVKQAAEKFGVPEGTVKRWRSEQRTKGEPNQKANRTKKRTEPKNEPNQKHNKVIESEDKLSDIEQLEKIEAELLLEKNISIEREEPVERYESLFPGITHNKKRAFLAAFAEVGTVTRAAEISGVCRKSHTNWLKSDSDYADAFALAEQQACDRLEQEARRRAVEGVDKPVYQRGVKVGVVREYSDTLLIFLMKGAMPEKYKDRVSQEFSGRLDHNNVSLAGLTVAELRALAFEQQPNGVITGRGIEIRLEKEKPSINTGLEIEV